MVNWHCISTVNHPWTLTESQQQAFKEAWEIFQQRTILNRLKKAAIVLLVCLLGLWNVVPTAPKDTLSPKIEAELEQTKLQLKAAKAQHERNYQAQIEQAESSGFPAPPLIHGVFSDGTLGLKIKQLERDLENSKENKPRRITAFKIFLAIFLAASFWLYLIAHTFDAGFKPDANDESGGSFDFHYRCSAGTLKENLLNFADAIKEAVFACGRSVQGYLATQSGCVLAAVGVSVVLFALALAAKTAIVMIYPFAIVIMCISTWLLLGWFIWSRPIRIRWDRFTTAPPEEVTYLRGRQLIEMPTASCSAPTQATPISSGDYLKGNVTLLEDGSYLIGSMMVDQASAFSGVNINGVTISKEFGAGNDIKFEVEEEELRVRFTQGQWWQVA